MGTLRTEDYWGGQCAQYLDADRYTVHNGVLSEALGAVFTYWWEHCTQCSIEWCSGRSIRTLMGEHCEQWAHYLHTDGKIAHNAVLSDDVGAVFAHWWENIAHSAVLSDAVGAVFAYCWKNIAHSAVFEWCSGRSIRILMVKLRTVQYQVIQWTQYSHTDGNIAHSAVLSDAVGAVFAHWWENITNSAVLSDTVGAVFAYWWENSAQCSIEWCSGRSIRILMGKLRTV
jgi:uncharacterized membrane-anchored protein